ncbi:MAG: AraC family transcriptional regulator [Verrucomicrobiota bacterium]
MSKLPREDVRLAAGQSFRLLRWKDAPEAVDLLQDQGVAVPWKGYGNRWHYHRELELACISRARGTRFIADAVDAVDGEDLVLIGANVPHYWDLSGSSEGTVLQWDFPRHHGMWGFAESAPLQALMERAKRGLNVRGHAAKVVRGLVADMAGVSGLGRLALFFKVLHALTDASPAEMLPVSTKAFSLEGTAQQQEAMSLAVSYLLANFRNGVRLEDLLRLTGMSRATFSRQFQRHAGKPFSELLNELRIQSVCRALRETDTPVAIVALEEGFNQLSFFNRIFRRYVGCTPREYRRRNIAGL